MASVGIIILFFMSQRSWWAYVQEQENAICNPQWLTQACFSNPTSANVLLVQKKQTSGAGEIENVLEQQENKTTVLFCSTTIMDLIC